MARKLKIAFVSPKRYSFYPLDYKGRGLGGSESALVLLSQALARRGHTVEVFNCCFKPGIYDGVLWKMLWEFNPRKKYDAVISLRLLETFENEVNAKVRAVWIHDDSLPGAQKFDKAGKVNTWVAVSKTEKDFISKKEKISEKRWVIIPNAYDANMYDSIKSQKKVSGQTIYCSAPDRGLKFLLEYWPAIKQAVPHATLLITGSFALWGNSDEENERFFKKLYDLTQKLDGVNLLKRIEKSKVAALQAKSELMLYPTVFDEMFCISALECMSVGTPVISGKRAAMNDRINHGIDGYSFTGSPASAIYKRKFVEKTIYLLKNKDVLQEFAENAIVSTENFTYTKTAEQWEKMILEKTI